ncbi:hypothetical protein COZ14_01225 [Candidatus Dojkabacteria bacterium CG_4_10_14_3_um_filter_Dojkabacteria_WS6_41_9]|nr:MAG: hypothetical protein COZ14_01225 [Candidatus Dojkabacteria bacterium CG_4_10_14_3_um_filter_Dojkabacteria_WS6_41_9]
MEKEHLNILKFTPFEAKHFQNGTSVQVYPLDNDFKITDGDISRIVSICNQKPIYNFLFAKRLKGEPYMDNSATGFIEWARTGWETGKYFVFLARDNEGKIVGAVDIKSDNVDGAEVGYWMDENSPGYMSNTVRGLVEHSRDVGFKKLIAFTLPNNDKSQRVLLRAGFNHIGQEAHVDDDGTVHERFEVNLVV